MRSEVVIVGDGIVSLTTALILSKSNIDVSIIKLPKPEIKNSGPKKLLAISLASCKLFQNYGIVKNINDIGQPINAIEVFKYNTDSTLTFLPQDIDEKIFGYFINETDLWQSLRQDLIKIKEIESEISTVKQDKNHVYIKLDDNKEMISKLLIIADGKNSKTRKKCLFESTVKPYKQIAFICNISHAKHHKGIAREIFMPVGPFAMLPEKSGYSSAIVWTLPEHFSEFIKSMGEEEAYELISPHCNEHLGDIKILSKPSVFNLTLDYANRAVNQRVVLAGDALHAIHPLAGQGLNLGLKDVSLLTDLIIKNYNLGLDLGSSEMLSIYNYNSINDSRAMIEVIGLIDKIYTSPSFLVQKIGSAAIHMIEECSVLKNIFIKNAVGH